jgi:phosphatidylinositol 4-phosphatase
VWFDFHGECKKMKWENLSKLVDIVKDKLDEYNHFVAEIKYGFDFRKEFNQARNINIISTQRGVMRTNCMDCLDRTNVVQGVFSR